MRTGKHNFLILTVVLIGFLIRLYKLTSSPEALYIDETSIAYNAYSIISTGHDEHGKFMPLFFEAFGEYKLPVYVYLVAFVQLFVGASDLSVRIPSLIFGTLSIFLIYSFAKELLAGFKIGAVKNLVPIMASFLLAVSPWHFQFSRPGFEASAGLFFLILALYLFFKGIKVSSPRYISLSLISFVATLYSYNSARIVTPVVVLILSLLYFGHFGLKTWTKISIAAFILATPFLNFSLNPQGLARARQVSVFFQKDASATEIFSNYLKNISPVYLFKTGDPTIAHLTPYRMSLIYLVEAPFFFLGLAYLISARSKNTLFPVVLLLISLIPPSLATLNPHALRGMLALSAVPIISAVGLGYFLSFFKKNSLYIVAILVFIFSVLVSTFLFLSRYHNKYTLTSGWDWQVGIKRASLRVLELEGGYQDIYLDLDPRAIPLLWYLKIDPALYQKSTSKNHLGKYHLSESIESDHGLYVGLKPPGGRLLEYIYYPDNTVASGIWEF